MSQEQYNRIIQNLKNTIDKEIIDKISNFKYAEMDNYYVIQVYIKESMKVKEMGEVLTNMEEFAKDNNYSIVVDFLRG
ncbi:hypothetical protein [Terrisporobacter petrolearius]|uniref:hypothetical protein n=1 Tax=Terrisporobacter petrolearius TaxID=1460447 RepID=UPI0031CC5B78